MLTVSCKTTIEYVPVPIHHTDTVLCHSTVHDSIWIHDSTFIKEKGDTVMVEKWHTKYVEKQVHDTTYVSKNDSVPVPYPVKEYVEKPLAWWQKTLMWLGVLAIGIFCVWVWKTK